MSKCYTCHGLSAACPNCREDNAKPDAKECARCGESYGRDELDDGDHCADCADSLCHSCGGDELQQLGGFSICMDCQWTPPV